MMLLVLSMGTHAVAWGEKPRKWERYENASLIADEYFDGDSFHVRHGDSHWIIRLCYVDTPETDTSVQERLVEQADYWGISVKSVMEIGDKAKTFTEEFLKDGMIVETQKIDARGRSDRDRYFGMVSVKGNYLSEALIANGLARVFGFNPILSDGTAASAHRKYLLEVEKEAKAKRRGAWGIADPTELVLKKSVAVYSVGAHPMFKRVLKRGTTLSILGDHSAFMVKVGYELDGEMVEGLCKRSDVGIWRSRE